MQFFEIDKFDPEQPYLISNGELEVCIDPIQGSGSTPDTGNINYMGFVAIISPSQFLELTHALDPDMMRKSAQHFIDNLPRRNMCVSPPSLSITDVEGWESTELGYWKVGSHEGRHRSYTLRHLGFNRIPVYIYPYQMRSRDISPEQLAAFGPLKSERGMFVGFKPDYIILNKIVYAVASSNEMAARKADMWERPIPIKTEPQKTLVEGYEDTYYYGSRPI